MPQAAATLTLETDPRPRVNAAFRSGRRDPGGLPHHRSLALLTHHQSTACDVETIQERNRRLLRLLDLRRSFPMAMCFARTLTTLC